MTRSIKMYECLFVHINVWIMKKHKLLQSIEGSGTESIINICIFLHFGLKVFISQIPILWILCLFKIFTLSCFQVDTSWKYVSGTFPFKARETVFVIFVILFSENVFE